MRLGDVMPRVVFDGVCFYTGHLQVADQPYHLHLEPIEIADVNQPQNLCYIGRQKSR